MATWKKVVTSGSSAALASLETSGGITVNGNTTLGNADSDTVTINADLASNITPDGDRTRRLGASGAQFSSLHVDSIVLGSTGIVDFAGPISGSSTSSGSFALLSLPGIADVSASIASAASTGGEANEFSFKTIALANPMLPPVVADSTTDTLTLGEGAGIAISMSAGDDTITFAVDGVLEDLDTLGAASSDGEFIVATGAGTFAYESGTTVRDSLELGTGHSPTFRNLTLDGDLTVQGSTTTLDTTNLLIEDRFLFIATGSAASNVDGGIIVQSGSNDQSGSALYHDKDSQRWAVAKDIISEATAVTPLSFVTTTTTNATAPSTASGSYGVGEMWVETDTQDIYIRTA